MEKLLQFWFDTASHGVAFLEPIRNDQGEIIHFCYKLVNNAFTRLVRQTQEALVGQIVRKVYEPGQENDYFLPLVTVVQTGGTQQLLKQYRLEGEDVWHDVTLTRVDDLVMVDVRDVSKEEKAKVDLQRRLAMESMLSAVSSRFITLKADEVDAYVVEALGQISTHIDAGRASVVLYSNDFQEGRCIHEWCAAGVEPRKDTILTRPRNYFDWKRQKLENGQTIRLQVDNLPPEAIQEKAFFEFTSVHSMIAVPLIEELKTQGFIGFYSINKPHTWDQNDVSLLETFSTLIANVLHRLRQEVAIQRANQRLEGLHDIDRALLSYRLANQSPLLIAMKYMQFMVPCSRITVFQMNGSTGLAVAKCNVVEGELDMNPKFSVPARYFYERFQRNQGNNQLIYYPDLHADSAGIPPDSTSYLKDFRSQVIIPLYSQEKCIGAFTLASAHPNFFIEEYRQIAQELAGPLAIVLYQQQLDEHLDQYTEQLAERVEERTREIKRLSTLHQAILKHAGQAIISTDIHRVIQTANQAAEHLLGYRVDELIGRVPYLEKGPPENPVPIINYQSSVESTSTIFADSLATQGYFHCECVAITKAGHRVPILLAVSALQDEDGTIIGYVGISTDISALKTAEAKLQQKNRELNTFFKGALDMHCISDSQGNISDVNRAFQTTLGYSADELKTIPFLQLIHSDEQKFVYHNLLVGILQQPVRKQVNQLRRKDGTYRIIEWNAIAIDRVVYGSARDITERQEAEVALRKSEQWFREIADNVDELFWIHSAEPFRLLYVNQALGRVWNTSFKQLRRNQFSFMDTILKEDLQAFWNFIEQYKAGKEGQLYFRVQEENGPLRWLLARTFMIRDAAGKLVRHIGIVNEVTGQKEKEMVLQQALQREQELNQLKSQFVSTASHEFRTPLATIQSSVELIKLYLDLPAANARVSIEKHLAVIEKEIEQFSSLLTDILTIGKIEAGKTSFNRTKVDVVSICKQIITTHFSQQSGTRSVQFEVEGAPRMVYLDDKLITHVIVNLLSNAFKFSKTDPHLRIVFKDNTIVLQVIDQGIGIPLSERSALFQAFFRASNTNGIPGTGLGLVIARQFVELHGGHFDIQSEEKKGTICTVTLPIE